MPLLSVIIPTYNRAELLKETLASVLASQDELPEVLVVDDGSLDHTCRFVATYSPKVKLLQQPNLGPGAARNLGLRQARGEYVAFLDSDDLWFPWSAAMYREAIYSQGKPRVIAGKPCVFQTRKALPSNPGAALRCLKFPDYLSSGDQWRWFGASSFVVHRDELERVDGFTREEGIFNEDADLALRLGTAPGFVQILAPETFGYRIHSQNGSRDVRRNISGAKYMIRVEKNSGYAGGAGRARERRRIETRHLRPVSLECLQKGLFTEAWSIYQATFRWHLALGRWKYVLGFPFLALKRRFQIGMLVP